MQLSHRGHEHAREPAVGPQANPTALKQPVPRDQAFQFGADLRREQLRFVYQKLERLFEIACAAPSPTGAALVPLRRVSLSNPEGTAMPSCFAARTSVAKGRSFFKMTSRWSR